MHEPAIFTNPEFGEIRTLEKDGNPWFVAADICRALEIGNPSQAVTRLDEDEKSTLISNEGKTLNIVSESGMYALVLSSRKPDAKTFKRWITHDVIPCIRKTGGYSVRKPVSDVQLRKLEVQERNAKTRAAQLLLKMTNVETLSQEYKNILVAKAAEVLTGVPVLPPQESAQKMYSAKEIGEMFGVSAQRIGKLSNAYGLKNDEYGQWYRDKSPYSSKEVDSFRYNDAAVERFREILEGETDNEE